MPFDCSALRVPALRPGTESLTDIRRQRGQTDRLTMRVAVLRVSGADLDPDAYVKRHGFTPDIIWRAGEPDRLGRVRSKSGFNLSIGDAVSAAALVKQVRGWVEDNMSALLALGGLGGVAVIDVGLTVGTSDQFTASVTLTPADLALLAKAGVELSVSAYPATEETESVPGI